MVDSFKQSLPPKVVGPVHGYLDLKIDQVVWTRRSNCAVKIKVHWWGQDSSEFLFRLGNKHEKTLYTYTIQTTFKLFRNYLMNCLGLTLSVIDEQMGTLIGVCVLKNLHLLIVDETPHEDLYPILNEYDSQIGRIQVGFRLCLLSNSQSKIISKSSDSLLRDHCLKVNSLDSQFNSSDSDNIVSSKIVHKVLKQGQRLRNAMVETILDNDPFNKDVYNSVVAPKLDSQLSTARNQSEFNKNTRVFDYLTGANVSPLEEEQILNTIRTISPAISMIQLASDLHFQNTNEVITQREKPVAAKNPTSQPQTSNVKISTDYKYEKLKSISQKSILTNNENENNLLSFVDSFKVYVYTLKFNSAGWRKVFGYDNKSLLSRAPTFFVEYVLPQLLNEDALKQNEKKTKVNSNIVNRATRFCSKKVVQEVIHFKQQSIHKIVNIESLNLSNLILELKIFSRNVSQRGATPIGIAKINLSDIIDQEDFTCDEELVVIDTNKPLGIGTLKVRLQFGCDKIHFGKEFIEAITCEKENRKLSNCDSITKDLHPDDNTHLETKIKKQNSNLHSILSKPITVLPKTKTITVPPKEVPKKFTNSILNEYQLATNFGNNTLNLLQCLIYIPEIHFETDYPKCTFLICRAFWREDTTISKLYYHTQRAVYQFREIIPLLYNSEFLSRTKNNYLIVEIWENDGNIENFLGICKLPLHQLYVAYRDPKVACHLAEAKLPVTAFDGWEEIIHPISLNRTGQLQALLAVGTESQIQFLEVSRGINEPSVGKRNSYNEFNRKYLAKQTLSDKKSDIDNVNTEIKQQVSNITQTNQNIEDLSKTERVIITQTNQNIEDSSKTEKVIITQANVEEARESKTVEESATQTIDLTISVEKKDKAIQTYITQSTQTDFIESEMEPNNQKSSEGNNNPNITKSNLLESFMELANKLSSPNQQIDQSAQANIPVENKSTEIDNPKLEDTSKLFEMLQKALSKSQPTPENSTFRAHVVIENAVHLSIRRRRIKSKGKHAKKHIEIMPTTYVSFEPIPEKGLLFTSIIPKCTNPRWNQHFECQIPRDMLYDDQKRLIFKVWNKNGTDYTQPNVVTDSVIGFAALDLTVLPAGLPNIQGWFNIMDFTSRCNGQIKINVTPLEDVSKKNSNATSVFIPPLSIPTPSPPGDDLFELTPSTSLLSNTLKRKFTELDEITERLKQRLMDVTKSDEDSDNNNEFEHDLNTEPPTNEEMDDFDFTKLDLKLNTCPPNTGVSAISVADSGFMESKDLETTSTMDMNDIIDKKMKENKIHFDALFEKLSLHMNETNLQNKLLDNISEESTESSSTTDLLRIQRNNQNENPSVSVSSITLSSGDRHLADAKLYDQFNSESDLSSFDLNSETILLNREAPEGAGNASSENLNQSTKTKK